MMSHLLLSNVPIDIASLDLYLRALIIEAVIGRYNSSNSTNDEYLERIKVLEEIQHPKYNRRALNYDLMLLKLEHAPRKQQNNRFMRLNSGQTTTIESRIDGDDDVGQEVVLRAIGWGDTRARNGRPSEVLQDADLNFIPNAECAQAREGSLSYNGRISEDMMCTFGDNIDTCYGTWTTYCGSC